MRMRFLVLQAYFKLILFDLYLLRGNFSALHEKVRRCRIRKQPLASDATARICAAVDMACIWYRKEVLCLQRSAATTCLLRQFGIAAEMIIGAQQVPFRSHAWVEVEHRVVSDKPYMREMYTVVETC
jgi:Transglutaminase-like superfamily